MQDFGTFSCVGADGKPRTYGVHADIDVDTLEINFLDILYGGLSLTQTPLRPRECTQPHEVQALSQVRTHLRQSSVSVEDFQVVDTEDC